MLVVDAHLDLSWNALQWNRDILQSAYTLRTAESHMSGPGRGRATVGFPELRGGRVALCFATLLARSTGRPSPNIDYASQEQAEATARGQLAYYRALERRGVLRSIRDAAALQAHTDEWATWETAGANASDTPPIGYVLSMEGADPIVAPDALERWWDEGLRLLGLTHYGPGRYAGGTGTEDGLTELGTPLLREMERLGVGLDLTHCSDQAFWQALEHFNGPVLASHNNCRALVPKQRQFSDVQLRAIIDRDGVIGAAFDAWMLEPGWTIGESDNRDVTLSRIVDHIEHVCELAGGTSHAAIGTDLDGGFGGEQSPSDLDTIADLQKLPELLSARGFDDDSIARIMHGNWLAFLERIWGPS